MNNTCLIRTLSREQILDGACHRESTIADGLIGSLCLHILCWDVKVIMAFWIQHPTFKREPFDRVVVIDVMGYRIKIIKQQAWHILSVLKWDQVRNSKGFTGAQASIRV